MRKYTAEEGGYMSKLDAAMATGLVIFLSFLALISLIALLVLTAVMDSEQETEEIEQPVVNLEPLDKPPAEITCDNLPYVYGLCTDKRNNFSYEKALVCQGRYALRIAQCFNGK